MSITLFLFILFSIGKCSLYLSPYLKGIAYDKDLCSFTTQHLNNACRLIIAFFSLLPGSQISVNNQRGLKPAPISQSSGLLFALALLECCTHPVFQSEQAFPYSLTLNPTTKQTNFHHNPSLNYPSMSDLDQLTLVID